MATASSLFLRTLGVALVVAACSHRDDPELAARSFRLADACYAVKLNLLDFQRRVHGHEWPVPGETVDAIWDAELDNLDVGLRSCSQVGDSCGFRSVFDVDRPGFEPRLDRWIGAILAGSRCVPSVSNDDDWAGWSRSELVSDSLHWLCDSASSSLGSLKVHLYVGQYHAYEPAALQEAWTQAVRPLLEVALPICTPDPQNCPRPPESIDGPDFHHQLQIWETVLLHADRCAGATPLPGL